VRAKGLTRSHSCLLFSANASASTERKFIYVHGTQCTLPAHSPFAMYVKEPVRKMRFAFLRPSQEVKVQFKKPDLGCVRRLKKANHYPSGGVLGNESCWSDCLSKTHR